MTIPQPPPGQGPVDPRGAFAPPPPPGAPSHVAQQQYGGYTGPPQGGFGAPNMPPPPPMMMPPPMYYPPPPPKQGGGFARAIFMTLATAVFGMSIALNVYLLAFSSIFSGGGGSQQHTLLSGDLKQKVAVVPLRGLIDDTSRQRFEKLIQRIESDSDVKAMVIEIDSPGGTVSASDEIHARLVRLKKEKGIPIVVAMGGVAASGGYYIACAADSIVAERTTLTGSIGVVMERYDLTKLADKWGIADASIHSTGADYKTAGSMLKTMTADEQKYILGLIDHSFGIFKDVVKRGRETKLKAPIDEIANGKIYTTAEAIKLGLVDQEGYAHDAYAAAATLAGLNDKHVVRYDPIPSFFDVFGAESKANIAPRGGGAGVTINGVNVNVDGNILREIATPKMMYLWRGQ
jgi:protease IV